MHPFEPDLQDTALKISLIIFTINNHKLRDRMKRKRTFHSISLSHIFSTPRFFWIDMYLSNTQTPCTSVHHFGDESGLQENELRALSRRSTLFMYREWMHEIYTSVNIVSSRILLD